MDGKPEGCFRGKKTSQATAIVELQYGGNGSQDANSTVGGAEHRECT
jgi:hypothetical protein